jgi:hypothetical protein
MDRPGKETLKKAYDVIAEIYGVLANDFYILGFLILASTQKNEFEWLAEGSAARGILSAPYGSSTFFTMTLILTAMVAVQLVIVVMGKRKWVRAAAGALIALALAVWAVRFI